MTGKTQVERQQHWEQVYAERDPLDVSWYQVRPERSLALIEAYAPGRDTPIIDMGSGASTLIDALIGAGYRDVTAVDISERGLACTRQRLGERAAGVSFIRSDVTAFAPTRRYRVWHDRAVFHFLTDPADRARYVAALNAALTPDGTAIVATFAPDGPERCSNLPVARYDQAGIAAVFEPHFRLIGTEREVHTTPAGKPQAFHYFQFQRRV